MADPNQQVFTDANAQVQNILVDTTSDQTVAQANPTAPEQQSGQVEGIIDTTEATTDETDAQVIQQDIADNADTNSQG